MEELRKDIVAAAAIIADVYIDKDTAATVAAALKEYAAGPAFAAHSAYTNLVIADINAILNTTSHDDHFIVTQPGGGNGRAGITVSTVHYISINSFESFDSAVTRQSFVTALGRLKSPAVIDLRGCLGGDVVAMQYLLCCLFPDGTKLFDLTTRSGEFSYTATAAMDQYLPPVTAVKYLGELKIIVSKWTFSAGETVAWVCQRLGRAEIYGHKTIGMGHFVNTVPLGGMTLRVLFARPTIDGQTIEKIGVVPDHSPESNEYIKTIYNEVMPQQLGINKK